MYVMFSLCCSVAKTNSVRRETQKFVTEGKPSSLAEMSVDEFFERGLTSSSEEDSDSGLSASTLAQCTRKIQQER